MSKETGEGKEYVEKQMDVKEKRKVVLKRWFSRVFSGLWRVSETRLGVCEGETIFIIVLKCYFAF